MRTLNLCFWEACRSACSCGRSLRGRSGGGGLTERHTEVREEGAALCIGLGGGDDRDVHALDRVDLVVLDLGEDDLLADSHGEVAAAVEPARRHAAEVADARQRDVQPAIEELPHALAAQRA